MAAHVFVKHSTTANSAPSSLQNGELAVNNTDGAMFVKKGTNVVDLVASRRLSALNTPNADISWGGFKITSVGTPVASDDAATKAYAELMVPVGAIIPWFGYGTAPAPFLRTDGLAYSRAAYLNLFHAVTFETSAVTATGSNAVNSVTEIGNVEVGFHVEGPGIPTGTTVTGFTGSLGGIYISNNVTTPDGTVTLRILPHGQGDGSTTFNVPDTRGRVIVGTGMGSGLANRTMAVEGGVENQSLTASDLPAHTHPITDPGHNHAFQDADVICDPGTTGYKTTSAGALDWGQLSTTSDAYTGITATDASASPTTAPNVMQPFVVAAYLIRY